jgi:hypothetical protein
MHYSSYVYLAMEVLATNIFIGQWALYKLICCPNSYPDDGLALPKPCLLNALGIIIAGETQKIYIYIPTWKDGLPPPVGWGGVCLRVFKVVCDVRLTY